MSQLPLASIEQARRFLLREARLLDEERFEDWLALLTTDIRYRMPAPQSRYRRDAEGPYSTSRFGFYDDDLERLRKRVARFGVSSAWSEDPPTRHIRLVSNIEPGPGGGPDEMRVRSVIQSWRSRGESDESWVIARRDDTLRRIAGGELRLAGRLVLLGHSVLRTKNLNVIL